MKKKLCAIIATLGSLFCTSNCMLLLLKMYCIHCWSGLSLDLLAPKRAVCLGGKACR